MHLLTLVSGLVGLYVILRVVLPARLFWPLKILASLLIFACAEKLYLVRLFYGSMSAYNMSFPAAVISGTLNAFVIMLFLLALLRDIWRLLRFVIRRRRDRSGRSGQLGLTAAAALLAVFSVWSALRVPDVREVDLYVPNLPPALAGLRIAQLSDLHIGPTFGERWLAEVVHKTNALHPDITTVTGDLVDGYPASRKRDIAPLADLKARYGVYVVPGNHEYYSSATQWIAFLRRMGLTVLVNDNIGLHILSRSGTESAMLTVAGITDPAARNMGLEAPNLTKALSGAIGTTLLLAHNPRLARAGARAGADIQLSGHTHGGQLLPLAPIAARFNEGYVAGTYVVDDMRLYVSRGTGLWGGMPLRLFCPSEITLLTLQPAETKK